MDETLYEPDQLQKLTTVERAFWRHDAEQRCRDAERANRQAEACRWRKAVVHCRIADVIETAEAA